MVNNSFKNLSHNGQDRYRSKIIRYVILISLMNWRNPSFFPFVWKNTCGDAFVENGS